MPFLYVLKEHKKDAHKYIEITGFEGNASNLVVPGEIDGVAVEAIGNHAFSRRHDIVSVELPGTIRILYGFAFHDCRNLKKISLHDSIDDYYDGVCRQCDSLTDIEIFMDRGWYEVIRNFLADNDRTLRFMIHVMENDGIHLSGSLEKELSCLTFPEYVYDFNENTMARTIQFSIAGSGMFYREVVDRRSINYRQYDALFEKAVIDGGEISENIAIGRILYPVELSDNYRSMYENFIRDNASAILSRLIENLEKEPENADTLKALVRYESKEALLGASSIDRALKLASDNGYTQVCALLMDGAKPPSGGVNVFTL
ncbi:MAG: leucine-rich repeat protein [Butyrivibrio sp.]|nr:leucine-rich repeat protein [Butyrivibrio sp.]